MKKKNNQKYKDISIRGSVPKGTLETLGKLEYMKSRPLYVLATLFGLAAFAIAFVDIEGGAFVLKMPRIGSLTGGLAIAFIAAAALCIWVARPKISYDNSNPQAPRRRTQPSTGSNPKPNESIFPEQEMMGDKKTTKKGKKKEIPTKGKK